MCQLFSANCIHLSQWPSWVRHCSIIFLRFLLELTGGCTLHQYPFDLCRVCSGPTSQVWSYWFWISLFHVCTLESNSPIRSTVALLGAGSESPEYGRNELKDSAYRMLDAFTRKVLHSRCPSFHIFMDPSFMAFPHHSLHWHVCTSSTIHLFRLCFWGSTLPFCISSLFLKNAGLT